jgi:hypothetical protein
MCCAQENSYMSIYVWQKGAAADDLPDDFYERLAAALSAAGMDFENQ